MNQQELEEHAARLEAELAELKQSIASTPDSDEKCVPTDTLIPASEISMDNNEDLLAAYMAGRASSSDNPSNPQQERASKMIEIHSKLIGGKYTEVCIEDFNVKVESGLMCDSEALEYANTLVEAANGILDCVEYTSGGEYNRCEIKKIDQ